MAKNAWLNVWTNPRETIRDIVKTNPNRCFYWLCAIYGLPTAFSVAQNYSFADFMPFWAILVASFALCTVIGAIGISITAWLLQVTGRWLGGKGKYTSIRSAIAWSNVPNIVVIAMWLVLIGVFGDLLFMKGFEHAQFGGFETGLIFLVFLIQTISAIWGFIIMLSMLGEVQGFSAWMGLVNVLIPFSIIALIVWLISLI